MPSCEVYLYGNSKSGCMQVDGLNKGFSVHGIIPVTFTPDESGYYRPGIYTSQDLNFPNCEMHLFVLEGVYAYDTVRGLVEFNDLNGTLRVWPLCMTMSGARICSERSTMETRIRRQMLRFR